MESIKLAEAEAKGFDHNVFSEFDEKKFIFACVTRQHFIRDGVRFVVAEKQGLFNLMRRSEDFAAKLRK